MKGDGKSALVIALGRPKGDDEEAPASSREPMAKDGEREEADESAAFDEAADMAFDAAKKGDRAAFREALKTAIYACVEELDGEQRDARRHDDPCSSHGEDGEQSVRDGH